MSIRRHETVPRAETAPPPSSDLVVTPVVSDGLLVYVRMYVVIYNLHTEAVSTPEYIDIASEGRMNNEVSFGAPRQHLYGSTKRKHNKLSQDNAFEPGTS